ncbi:MAG: hypothetical protein CM15mV2_1360 [uncultured marine virus]|nr:MAG: hypothetical protein CM15mV2_1360 [uncultured marine virus]
MNLKIVNNQFGQYILKHSRGMSGGTNLWSFDGADDLPMKRTYWY